jgi:subtilisin family serine protease
MRLLALAMLGAWNTTLHGQIPPMPTSLTLDGQTNAFSEAPDELFLQFADTLAVDQQQELLNNSGILPITDTLAYQDLLGGWFVTLRTASDWPKAHATLLALPEITYLTRGLYTPDGTLEFPLPNLYAQTQPGMSDLYLFSQWARDGLQARLSPTMGAATILTSPAREGHALLTYVNSQTDNGLYRFLEPNMIKRIHRLSANDPRFNRQWALQNNGSSLQYNGTPNEDMQVTEAWNYTQGNSDIKVAILDEGVDLDHPDLVANLLPGFDGFGQTAGDAQNDDAHGTACAGIVAAVANNNLGVAGVAPNCKIIPVRIAYSSGGYWVTSSSTIANCINWAWNQGGADVLSNSWGGGSSSSLISSAIANSVNNGRGGLGAPVLFASGNSNNNVVSYPASLNDVIAVAATSMCGERKNPESCDGEFWWGANYGSAIDIGAPGVKIPTTDIAGGDGYNGGDYTNTFNGTSSACPNAAGVMALILSADPSLNADQARFYLESTADKTGGYTYSTNASYPNGTWNEQLGYGRVNAHAALQAIINPSACLTEVTMNLDQVTQSTATLIIENVQASDDYYLITYGPQSLFPNQSVSAQSANTSITLPDLNPGTDYTVHLQVVCENGDTSFVRAAHFTTLCASASYPYLETFDSWAPFCWDLEGGDAQVVQASNDYLEASFWIWPDQSAYAKSQPIEVPADAQVSFRWAHKYISSYPNDQLILRARPIQEATWDTLTFMTGASFDSPNAQNYTPPSEGDFVTETISLDNNRFANKEVLFEFIFNSGFGPHAFVDDFEITGCSAPELRSVSANQTQFCDGINPVILTIDGDLNDADHWVIYAQSCGGIRHGQTTGSSYVVFPTVTTTFYVRAEGSCTTGATCESVSITIGDHEAPVARCQDQTVVLSNEGIATLSPEAIDQGSSDNCGPVELSLSQTAFDCDDAGTLTVVLTASDSHQYDTCQAIVTIADQTAPDPLCTGFKTIHLDREGQALITAGDVLNNPGEACGISSYSLSQTSFDCSQKGLHTVSLTATDEAGNEGSCETTIHVVDTVRPEVTCRDTLLLLDEQGQASLTPEDLLVTSSDACGVALQTLSQTSFDCADPDSLLLILTVTDQSDRSGSCVSQVILLDTISPQARCADIYLYLDESGEATLLPASLDAGSTDNCGIANRNVASGGFSCADLGNQSVQLQIEDFRGNTSFCESIVSIRDTITPTAICRDTFVFLDGQGQGMITPDMIDAGSFDQCGLTEWGVDQDVVTCADGDTALITLQVADAGGNIATCQSQVLLFDTLAPIARCKDTVLYLPASGVLDLPDNLLDAGSSDNCGIGAYGLSRSRVTCADVGELTLTMAVNDTYGNGSACAGLVTIRDTITPLARCRDTSIYLDQQGMAVLDPVLIDASGPDACGTITRQLDRDVFLCADRGPQLITLTIMDPDSNTSFCQSTVQVLDTIAPSAQCRDTMVYLDETGTALLLPSMLDSGSFDNCAIVEWGLDRDLLTCSDLGVTPIALQVADVGGNIGSCTAQVTVLDTIAPVAQCRDTTVYLPITGILPLPADLIDGGSSDNCAIVEQVTLPDQVTCADVGSLPVTMQIADGGGNIAECIATLTVVDTITPVASCRDTTIYLDTEGMAVLPLDWIDASGPDACGIASRTLDIDTFTCADLGPQLVTLTVTDLESNASFCESTVVVTDTVKPTARCRDTTVYLGLGGGVPINPPMINDGSTDNCGSTGMSLSLDLFTCSDLGINEVTLQIADSSGNIGTCTAQITVVDPIDPQVSCLDANVYLDALGQASITPVDLEENSLDNCGIIDRSLDHYTFDCGDVGIHPVRLTILTGNGDTASCVSQVMVFDTIAPSIMAADLDVALRPMGDLRIDSTDLADLFYDACGPLTFDTLEFHFDCTMIGPKKQTIRATDAHGNSTTLELNIMVRDTSGLACADEVICEEHPRDRSFRGRQNGHRNAFAQRGILASATIPPGLDTRYEAGEVIILEPGFHARPGARFLARIRPCRPQADAEEPVIGTYLPPGSSQPATHHDLRISPNPAINLATVRVSLASEQTCQLALFDLQGRPVRSLLLSQKRKPGRYDIDLYVGDLPSGLYAVRLITDVGVVSKTLVVQ